MIPCNEKCILYGKCELTNLNERCIFDMGIPEEEKDGDEFLEKLTY